MDFTRNVGRNDKNIRIAAGVVLTIIGLFFAKSFLLTIIGVILLTTGIISFCPLYQFLGKSTATAAETVSASDDLSERASENIQDFKEEAVETAQELKEKAGNIAEDLKEDAGELIDTTKQKAEDLKDDAGELIDDAKQKIDETKDSMKK